MPQRAKAKALAEQHAMEEKMRREYFAKIEADKARIRKEGASEVAKKNQILAAEQEAKASLEDKLLKLQNKYQKEIRAKEEESIKKQAASNARMQKECNEEMQVVIARLERKVRSEEKAQKEKEAELKKQMESQKAQLSEELKKLAEEKAAAETKLAAAANATSLEKARNEAKVAELKHALEEKQALLAAQQNVEEERKEFSAQLEQMRREQQAAKTDYDTVNSVFVVGS
ncbi:hypothetical protein AAMO2058_001197500 [Amorphochlora amoebiformis]